MQNKYIYTYNTFYVLDKTLNKCIESRLQENTFLYIKISIWSGWGGKKLVLRRI